jgi:hypothetical protein
MKGGFAARIFTNRIKMGKLIYGVDPGFGRNQDGNEKKRVGIASIDTHDGAIKELCTMTFSGAIEYLRFINYQSRTVEAVVVEVPRTKKSWHGIKPTTLINIGMGLAAMEIMAAILDLYWGQDKVVKVYPCDTDLTHEQFSLLTGWTGRRCSQDARNAAMMALNYWKGAYRAKQQQEKGK